MAITPEVKVKAAVRKLIASYGPRVYHCTPPANGYGSTGIPDILICCNGTFVAVECKAGRGKPTALQEKHLADIKAAGGVSLVINETNIDELRAVLDGLWLRATTHNTL